MLTFIRATDELDSGEKGNSARQEHGERPEGHTAVPASHRGSLIPFVEFPTLGLIVDVVEEAVFRDEQGVTLERSLCNKITIYIVASE